MEAPSAGDMDRDDRFTTEVVQHAARLHGVNPTAILGMSGARTLPGPVRQGWDRDLTHEALEELADAINYIPWEINKQQQLGAPGLQYAQKHYINALAACVTAFEELRAGRDALTEPCNRCRVPMRPISGEFVPLLECPECGRQIPR